MIYLQFTAKLADVDAGRENLSGSHYVALQRPRRLLPRGFAGTLSVSRKDAKLRNRDLQDQYTGSRNLGGISRQRRV
jgi:hypothetical protein